MSLPLSRSALPADNPGVFGGPIRNVSICSSPNTVCTSLSKTLIKHLSSFLLSPAVLLLQYSRWAANRKLFAAPRTLSNPHPSKVYRNEELSRYMLHFLYFLWSVSGLKIAGSVSSYLQYKNTHSSISLKQWVEQLSFACVVISRDLWNCLILNMILNMIVKLARCVRSDMKKAVTLSTYYLNLATQTVLHLCIFFTAGLHGVN